MPSALGLHASYNYFIGRKRDYDQARRSYDEWLAKREKTKQNWIDQIQSIKNNPSSKKSNQLGRLEYQLAIIESEDAEVADAAFLRSFPNAYKSQRPAYVKLTFENAIKATEDAAKLAEEAYRKALQAKEDCGELPSYLRKGLEPECLDVAPPSPTKSATTVESTKGPKQTKLQKLTAYLAKLESGQSVTKTFATKREEGLGENKSKWGFYTSTYYPKNAHAARLPSSP